MPLSLTGNPYLTWTPTEFAIKSTEPASVAVSIVNNAATGGGEIVFMATPTSAPVATLQLNVPANGTVKFFAAGKFDKNTGRAFPSSKDKDTTIIVRRSPGTTELAKLPAMVRIRKNANALSSGERDLFLDALVKLNLARNYVTLQSMHVSAANNEIHGRSCFLPWHRGFLLDLERRLQAITPSVTLPFWDFNAKAPKVFSPDFMGVPDSIGMVNFSNTNPLVNWQLQLFGQGNNNARVRRSNVGLVLNNQGTVVGRSAWNPATRAAITVQNTELQTLNRSTSFTGFDTIEGDPHGSAHVSFDGQVTNIGQAPADPLFFLLHTNIDRLWAKWQWSKKRFNSTMIAAYPNQGNGNPRLPGAPGIGNFTDDTMWPWNGVKTAPRPLSAPGNGMPGSSVVTTPGTRPTVRQMIDYQGKIAPANDLNFAYIDVPFND